VKGFNAEGRSCKYRLQLVDGRPVTRVSKIECSDEALAYFLPCLFDGAIASARP